MCGIVGAIARRGRLSTESIRAALVALNHRGPDDSGAELVDSVGDWDVLLGHARLSIVDLSPAGHQPMTGAMRRNGEGVRGSIVFNGEVYNFRTLRERLATREFASTGDTEVLLKGLLESGPSRFLPEANAMLALAFWDHAERRLTLARDRMGKKPLYLYRGDGVVAFASELKAFHAMGLPLTVDPEALAYYHWLRHVPFERSIFRECTKVPAASFLPIDLGPDGPAVRPSELFWDPLAACATRYSRDFDAALDEFSELLDDATRIRLEADVPVGVFLSAGVDSSLVAASASRVHGSPPTAFTVRAADPRLDESTVARETARRLGMPSEVLSLGFEDYHRQIEKVPFHYDEPCAPLSQLPTMAIAEAARKHVTVVLTGDGGDELFLGYPWLAYPSRLHRVRRAIDPVPGARRLASAFLRSSAGEKGLHLVARLARLNTSNLAVKRELAASVFEATRPEFLYDHFQQNFPIALLDAADRAQLGPRPFLERAKEAYPGYSWEAAESRPLPELLAALEFVTTMRDEILVKVDRGTMAYSLEARSPLLDHRIVEFAFALPLAFKLRGRETKRILREACARALGPELAKRKKSGFGVPHPPSMPPGPTPDVRWARAVEASWRERWLPPGVST
ncbi:MAG: asparagine synthase (glutamine-hydrolyzing) [Polyangiaceae bacterium]